MGISLGPGLFLARHRATVAPLRNGVILGRQKLHMRDARIRRFIRLAARQGVTLTAEQLTQEDGFSEAFFAALGYPSLEALDFTDKEGAGIIHDLNLPLPDGLAETQDLVIDGGTTEHIFHISTALETCHRLLRPGGVFMSYVACDGWFGHGFFQTGPDVPWRYWHHALGYEMIEVSTFSRKEPERTIPVPDPTGRPRGGERALTGPHMLTYVCRKPRVQAASGPPIQGHYVASPRPAAHGDAGA